MLALQHLRHCAIGSRPTIMTMENNIKLINDFKWKSNANWNATLLWPFLGHGHAWMYHFVNGTLNYQPMNQIWFWDSTNQEKSGNLKWSLNFFLHSGFVPLTDCSCMGWKIRGITCCYKVNFHEPKTPTIWILLCKSYMNQVNQIYHQWIFLDWIYHHVPRRVLHRPIPYYSQNQISIT